MLVTLPEDSHKRFGGIKVMLFLCKSFRTLPAWFSCWFSLVGLVSCFANSAFFSGFNFLRSLWIKKRTNPWYKQHWKMPGNGKNDWRCGKETSPRQPGECIHSHFTHYFTDSLKMFTNVSSDFYCIKTWLNLNGYSWVCFYVVVFLYCCETFSPTCVWIALIDFSLFFLQATPKTPTYLLGQPAIIKIIPNLNAACCRCRT